MKDWDLLGKISAEGRLELVDPSEEISESFMKKAEDCLKSAEVLLPENLYENSISMSYYAMYNSLTVLLRKVGIKCENHTAAIVLLKLLFKEKNLWVVIKESKEERIDTQYYIKIESTKETAKDLSAKAENFVVAVKFKANNLKEEEIEVLRKEFEDKLKDE